MGQLLPQFPRQSLRSCQEESAGPCAGEQLQQPWRVLSEASPGGVPCLAGLRVLLMLWALSRSFKNRSCLQLI